MIFLRSSLTLLLAASSLVADDKVVFFEKRIRPVLIEKCYSCHSAEAQAKKKLRGGLLLDSRAGVLAGGDTGPAVVPGKLQESLLLQSLRHDGDLNMPPKGKLPASVIADFEKWIAEGAVDPRDGKVSKQQALSVAEGRSFWAYQPPRATHPPTLPQAADFVDAYVQSSLRSRGLDPAPEADRATLLRRLTFDLIGLPPTPDEIDDFLRDARPDAYERVVDRLLASPHFGERWGRHWLDLARYAESLTLRGFVLKQAWRYRDYVIDSLNEDIPFDQFVREQIAGDLMPSQSVQQTRRQRIATTFLTLGNTNLEDQDKRQLRMDVVDEQLDTIGRAILAQTLGCARCHDHKFDPIPTRDYYALAGILRNTRTLTHANVSKWLEFPLPHPEAEEPALQAHEDAVAVLEQQIRSVKASRTLSAPEKTAKTRKLETKLKRLKATGPRRDHVMSIEEEPIIEDTHVHVRGSVHVLGDKVPRGVLSVTLQGEPLAIPVKESGRRELAVWLTSADNPLTARVFVNRAWHWLLGAGLVRTTDNFGTTGEKPSHPELLDALALQFVRDGWSVKALARRIVLSRVYRQASGVNPADPENRWLSHARRRRLDAESLRDTTLHVSGELLRDHGGATYPANLATDYGFKHTDRRRSVYAPIFRNALPELFQVFDFADPSVTTGRRTVSTVAPQALFLMNHPFILDRAAKTANRLLSRKELTDSARLTYLYRLALSRPPSERELTLCRAFLQQSSDREKAWAQVVQVVFSSLDFRYLK